MALTQNMAYDHPAYTSVHWFGGANTAGANAIQARFAAFTDMVAKSFTATVVTAGTSTGHTLTLVKALGTSTTTLGVTTIGTAVAATTTNVLCTSTSIAAGEVVWIVAGTDATGVFATGIELVLKKGASVSPA